MMALLRLKSNANLSQTCILSIGQQGATPLLPRRLQVVFTFMRKRPSPPLTL